MISQLLIQQFLLWVSLKFLGVFLGFLLPVFEAIGFALFLHPERPESDPLKTAVANRNIRDVWREAYVLLKHPLPFIHRGIVFYAAFCVVALFVMTSANSLLGLGVLAGFGLHLLWAMFPHRKSFPDLQQRFFLGLAKHVSRGAIISLIALLSIIVIWAILA